MPTLVTGGAGFIGSHVVDRLVEDGREVVVLDDFNDYYSPEVKRANIAPHLEAKSVTLFEGDTRNAQLVDKVVRDCKVAVIIHLAARAGVRDSLRHPVLYEEVNCRGTLNMLEAARNHGVRKFVFASSSSVYGGSTRIPFSEEDPVMGPISPYAATKRAGELYCHTYHHLYDLPCACLRFFTVYGPRGRPRMAIYKFTRLIDNGRPIPVYGDGTARRDFTFIRDIVQGVVGAADTELEFEIFNLGESRVVVLSDLIALIEENLGKKAEIDYQETQPGDVPITYADISKARRLLGYNPTFPIDKGVGIFVDWYRDHGIREWEGLEAD